MKVSRFVVPAFALSLLAASLAAVPASAAEPATPEEAVALAEELGDARTAGSYYDQATGDSVVMVTDSATADRVRAAGATPRMAARSGARLAQVQKSLDASGVVPGSAWGVDIPSNTVEMTVSPSLTSAERATVDRIAARHGKAVRVTTSPGPISRMLTGGDEIRYYRSSGYTWCSVGFNVVYSSNPSKHAFLSAGHCAEVGRSWYTTSRQHVADVARYSWPDDDYAIFDYVSGYTHYPSAVGGQQISSAGNATVGQSITRRGATTGTRSGQVTALNVTVTYDSGETVRGMTRTSVCAQGGDSGGSFYSGSTAYGMLSGGAGTCSTSGAWTIFQPVGEALSAYGVRIG